MLPQPLASAPPKLLHTPVSVTSPPQHGKGYILARTWRAAQLLQLLQQRALDALHLLLLVLVGPRLWVWGRNMAGSSQCQGGSYLLVSGSKEQQPNRSQRPRHWRINPPVSGCSSVGSRARSIQGTSAAAARPPPAGRTAPLQREVEARKCKQIGLRSQQRVLHRLVAQHGCGRGRVRCCVSCLFLN